MLVCIKENCLDVDALKHGKIEDYESIKTQSQAWRDEINTIEGGSNE